MMEPSQRDAQDPSASKERREEVARRRFRAVVEVLVAEGVVVALTMIGDRREARVGEVASTLCSSRQRSLLEIREERDWRRRSDRAADLDD